MTTLVIGIVGTEGSCEDVLSICNSAVTVWNDDWDYGCFRILSIMRLQFRYYSAMIRLYEYLERIVGLDKMGIGFVRPI